MIKFEKISKEQWQKDLRGLPELFGVYDSIEQFASSYKEVRIPQRGTSKSAGYDLYAPVPITLKPGEQAMIPSGLKVQMNDDNVMLIVIRSSLGIKQGIDIPNQVGVVDADYYNNADNEGHFWICLRNNSDKDFAIKAGDRISQAIFVKYDITEDDQPIKDVRTGGFGSTNKEEK